MAENHFYWIVVYGWSDLENPELTSRLFLAFVGKNSMHRKVKWSECHKMIYSKDFWWVPVCHALVEKWHFRIFFLKLNLDSLTIYYDLQLCEGFCCIELVLTEICTLSANVMTTDRCNVNVLSSCFSAYCNALFYCCGISIILSRPWWNLSSEFQTIMVPGCQHEDSDPWDPGIRQVVKQMLATKNVSSWGSSSSGYAEDLADLELGLDIFSDTSACGRAGDGLERCSIQ